LRWRRQRTNDGANPGSCSNENKKKLAQNGRMAIAQGREAPPEAARLLLGF
jgi:hypothetical protein